MQNEEITILFVDDEPSVLYALRRSLRRERWKLLFTESGAQGLAMLSGHRVDMVVSDMRMPGMDGVAFLKQVKELYSYTVRIILSGYAGKEAIRQVLVEECAHEILGKPWDDEELKATLRSLLQRPDPDPRGAGLEDLIHSISSLPTLPQVYLEMRKVLEKSGQLSANRIAAVIERDPSISARLLRWANSALFGQKRRVETVQHAVVVLGMEMVEALVLSMSVFDALAPESPELPGFNREAFWRHSVCSGIVARLIARDAFPDPTLAERAFHAGLLHDLGKLVEDRCLHGRFSDAIDSARRDEGLLLQAERKTMGATHNEIGAYLTEWWSLPPYLVNAIRHHHTPGTAEVDGEFVAVIQAADVLAQHLGIGQSGNFSVPSLDPGSEARFGLSAERLAAIRDEIERSIP